MNTIAFILVLLLIGQTVAFDLSKLWLPGNVTGNVPGDAPSDVPCDVPGDVPGDIPVPGDVDGKFDILLIFVHTIVYNIHNYRYLSYKYGIGIHEWHLPLC